ncbi:unnamed protein product [Ixodes pacificus]
MPPRVNAGQAESSEVHPGEVHKKAQTSVRKYLLCKRCGLTMDGSFSAYVSPCGLCTERELSKRKLLFFSENWPLGSLERKIRYFKALVAYARKLNEPCRQCSLSSEQ